MNINLGKETSPQFYHFLLINAKEIFDGDSLMVRFECFLMVMIL